jgi:hypothetical protein
MVQPTFCPEKTSSRTFERSGSCPKFMTGGRPITIPAFRPRRPDSLEVIKFFSLDNPAEQLVAVKMLSRTQAHPVEVDLAAVSRLISLDTWREHDTVAVSRSPGEEGDSALDSTRLTPSPRGLLSRHACRSLRKRARRG